MTDLLARASAHLTASATVAAHRAKTLTPNTRRDRVEIALGSTVGALALLTGAASAAPTAAEANTNKLRETIGNFIDLAVLLAGALAVLVGVLAGLQFMGAGGNENTARKAKKTIINVLLGLVVIGGIFLAKDIVLDLVAGASGTNGSNTNNITNLRKGVAP